MGVRAAIAAVLLVLLALVPTPGASAAAWSLDARLTVRSDTTADYAWTIAGLTNTNLTLPVPDQATFVEARDVDGRPLASGAIGDDVYVVSGQRPFTIRFQLEGTADGPFVHFPAQVAAHASSPVTVALAMPAGWTLVGYRDNDGVAPDTSGVFRHQGPAYVQFLLLPPGVADPGPDSTIAGTVVKREAHAKIGDDGIAWSLTMTYDTDVFRRDWEIHVPEGGRLVGASTPFGPLAAVQEGELVKLRAPYPTGLGLGARSLTVEMELPPPTSFGGAFRQANLSVRAMEGDVVRVSAELPEGALYAGARPAGGRESAPLRFEASEPMHVALAYLPAPAAGHVQFSEGLFVVDAPARHEAAARATARNASRELPRAASFAYDAAEDRPFYVAYTDAPIFAWEKGFYSNGLNTISIRASTLDEGASLTAVGVLVHEAAHGLLDRLAPEAPHDLSLLHEGLARLAETRLEEHFPEEVIECDAGFCERHSARPAAERIREFHQQARTLDVAWTASRTPEAERAFLYDYSGLVFHAYSLRAPPGALENALAHVRAADFAEEPAAQARQLVDILLANAPGTTETALLYPGREAAHLPERQFRACMGTLVAPAFRWEDVAAPPPGGCPASGYGGQDAPLPPPPSPATPTPPPSPSPVAATPRPTFEVPTSFPTTVAPADGPGVPGSVVRGGAGEVPPPGSTDVPAAGAALVAVALLGVAFLRRR